MRVEVKSPKKIERPVKRWPRIALIIAIVLALGTLMTLYIRTESKLKQLESHSQQSSQQEAVTLISAVGKLMRLPDEQPTIATVEDTSKLKDQSFFRYAEKGDKVLMYVKSKKAILYRPSTDKIIEIAYLNVG